MNRENENYLNDIVYQIKKIIDNKKILNLNEYLQEFHPRDIAEIILKLEDAHVIRLFEALPIETGAKVLDEMDSDLFIQILSGINENHKKDLLDLMSKDDMVDKLYYMSSKEREKIISILEFDMAEDIKELLIYNKDSAGGRMTTNFVALRKDMKSTDAIEYLRENAPDAETIYYVYVVDKKQKLVGVLSLRELIISNPNSHIEDIMSENVIYVTTTQDQEDVAKLVSKYDLLAIPVVDINKKLRGIITVDDIIDVIQEEATEDIYKFAGTSESESDLVDDEKSFVRIISSVKARLPWLIITLFGGILSARILGRYQDTLSQYTQVAYFMPLLTGMGGNVGTQSSTLTVRGLATGYVNPKKSIKIILQEVGVGALVGVICSSIVCVVAYLWMRDLRLGLVVGIAMAANMITAATIGTVVPIVFKKMGVDPAVASAPFISTTLDMTGITIYFTLTTLLLLKIS